MDKISNTRISRLKAAEKKTGDKDQLTEMAESAGFAVIMGFFVLAAGLMCFVQFRNRFSMYLCDAGFILVLYGFCVKIADLARKIIWGGPKK